MHLFQARNRHNLEQSSKLAQNKDLLNKRNAQVTVMDQRIGDLRERLHKKRAEVQNFTSLLISLFKQHFYDKLNFVSFSPSLNLCS